ncbi:sulfotransferase [Sandarakinorhabdus sp.]|uniref:sulfotransferase n=1 Tax=Sandarakinorhabdus sp. TaxID=1916663 RepID=UPI00286D7A44|nr:sulfotransferase [Sandarakinorhabdus sp.]
MTRAAITKPPLPTRIATKLRRWQSRLARVPAGAGPERWLFIVTYGRSGSTILQKLLGSITGHYLAGENHNSLHGVFAAWRDATILKAKYGWGHEGIDHPWHGADVADPDGYARAMVAAFVANILRPPRGTRVAGFKEIRYLTEDLREYLLFIDRFFAPAVFVINVRSVDAVAQSAWWKDADKQELAANIARFEAITDALVAEFPDRFIKIDYARWTSDPETLRPVYAMLDARFDATQIAETLSVRLEHMRG